MDSILSRSLTAKEIYNTMHPTNPHLANSLKCMICQQPLTQGHPCLYDTQPNYEMKNKIADLYYNWTRYHSNTLKEATQGTTLHTVARNMSYSQK